MRRVLALAVLLAGCGGTRTLAWEYTLDPAVDASAAAMVARVRAGSCTGAVAHELAWRDGSPAPAGPRLAPGTYALEIEVRDASCAIVGRGCTAVTLPSDAGAVRVEVAAVTGGEACPGVACDNGLCEGMGDAGVPIEDGGADAGGGDAGRGDDAGPGDDCTSEADCPCTGDTCTAGRCVPVRPSSHVAAGELHTCTISGGRLYCWGDRFLGEAGLPYSMTEDEPTPQRIGGFSDWTAISTTDLTTCGVQGGSARCMGSNSNSTTGTPESEMNNVFAPTVVPGTPPARDVVVGFNHAVMITATGALWSWGDNSHTEVRAIEGMMTGGGPVEAPREVDPGPWLDVSAGAWVSCGIRMDRRLYCWGRQVHGSLGDAGSCPAMAGHGSCGRAVEVAGGPRAWEDVDVGRLHTCARTMGGEVFCWGNGTEVIGVDESGALGIGSIADSNEPVPVSGITGATRVAANRHSCAIDGRGTLFCWGPNEDGQIGTDSAGAPVLDPFAVAGGPWAEVSTGTEHTCAIDAVGALWCWGSNASAQLGLGTTTPASTATPSRVCVAP